jgi:hypothetical protein
LTYLVCYNKKHMSFNTTHKQQQDGMR